MTLGAWQTGIVAALFGILAQGCAGLPIVYNHVQYHDRWPELIDWHSDEPFQILVWGNPFDSTQSAVDAAVAESMSRRAKRTLLVHSDSVVPDEPYFSVVFDAAVRPTAYECLDIKPVELVPAAPGTVKVRMAVCRGGAALTRVEGTVGDVDSPDDPTFLSLIEQMAERLYRGPPTP